mgnify:CR=1 FL=1
MEGGKNIFSFLNYYFYIYIFFNKLFIKKKKNNLKQERITSSSLAIACSFSAIADYSPTSFIRTSVSSDFFFTSIILISRSFYNPSTFDLVSAKIANPDSYFCI